VSALTVKLIHIFQPYYSCCLVIGEVKNPCFGGSTMIPRAELPSVPAGRSQFLLSLK